MREIMLGTINGRPDVAFLDKDAAAHWLSRHPQSSHNLQPLSLEEKSAFQLLAGDWLVKDTSVYGMGCIGCMRTKREIMVAYRLKGDPRGEFFDLFLSQEQAEWLHEELGKQIGYNKEYLTAPKSSL